jgi:hypothetical protein
LCVSARRQRAQGFLSHMVVGVLVRSPQLP